MCTKIFLLKRQNKSDRTKQFICCPRSTIYRAINSTEGLKSIILLIKHQRAQKHIESSPFLHDILKVYGLSGSFDMYVPY